VEERKIAKTQKEEFWGEPAQLHSYLKATGHHLGLLLNFDASVLQIRRVIASQNL